MGRPVDSRIQRVFPLPTAVRMATPSRFHSPSTTRLYACSGAQWIKPNWARTKNWTRCADWTSSVVRWRQQWGTQICLVRHCRSMESCETSASALRLGMAGPASTPARAHHANCSSHLAESESVENRIYRLLYKLACDEGQDSADGTLIPRFPTQLDLASRVGACRETVSRIVADLARKQVLSQDGCQVTLAP